MDKQRKGDAGERWQRQKEKKGGFFFSLSLAVFGPSLMTGWPHSRLHLTVSGERLRVNHRLVCLSTLLRSMAPVTGRLLFPWEGKTRRHTQGSLSPELLSSTAN